MGLERISTFKKELGVTNAELSAMSGVPKSTLDKITSGLTSNPNIDTVKALVHALGKTLNDLEDDPATSNKKLATAQPPAQRIARAYSNATQRDQGIVAYVLEPYMEDARSGLTSGLPDSKRKSR